MKFKLLKVWKGRPVGTVFEPEIHDVGRLLVRRGIAEEVIETPEPEQKKKPKLQDWVKNTKAEI